MIKSDKEHSILRFLKVSLARRDGMDSFLTFKEK